MKSLLIGEAPSKNEHPPTPLEGRIGRRLAEYAGISFEDFLERFERMNLLAVRQDTKEKGFEFDADQARINAMRLDIAPNRTVVLLGHRVARAFGLRNATYFKLYDGGQGRSLYVIPHPSGVNRWWNDVENQIEAARFMRSLAKETHV